MPIFIAFCFFCFFVFSFFSFFIYFSCLFFVIKISADEKWAQDILLGPSKDDSIPDIDDLLSMSPKKNFTSTSTSISSGSSALTKLETDASSEKSDRSDKIERSEEDEKAYIEESMQKDIAASKNKRWGNNDVNQGYFDGKSLLDNNNDLDNSEAKSLNDQLNALKAPPSPGLFSGTFLSYNHLLCKGNESK